MAADAPDYMNEPVYTVRLRKTGIRAFMNGRVFWRGPLSRHATTKIDVYIGGLLEACYDLELAKELSVIVSERIFTDEAISFICGVNHLLLRKVGLPTRLYSVAGISRRGGLADHMQQLFDRHIPMTTELFVNISGRERNKLINNWTWIHASQNVSSLVKGRSKIVSDTHTSLQRVIEKTVISKRLARTLNMEESKTDNEVMRRLNLMAPIGSYE